MGEWRESAQCVGDDPDRYVLDHGPHFVEHTERQRVAAELCDGCPVRRECAIDALLRSDRGVVRGGIWLVEMKKFAGRERRRRLSEAAGLSLSDLGM